MKHVRQIENKLALLDSAIKNLQDARNGLNKHLFDRIRTESLCQDVANSIELAKQTLSEV